MLQRVRLNNVKKGQRVTLARDLPIGQGFGNKSLIKQGVRGDIISNGFENGRLKVSFYTHLSGGDKAEFNELSAANYLLTDIY